MTTNSTKLHTTTRTAPKSRRQECVCGISSPHRPTPPRCARASGSLLNRSLNGSTPSDSVNLPWQMSVISHFSYGTAQMSRVEFSFHLPLHRHLAAFIARLLPLVEGESVADWLTLKSTCSCGRAESDTSVEMFVRRLFMHPLSIHVRISIDKSIN